MSTLKTLGINDELPPIFDTMLEEIISRSLES